MYKHHNVFLKIYLHKQHNQWELHFLYLLSLIILLLFEHPILEVLYDVFRLGGCYCYYCCCCCVQRLNLLAAVAILLTLSCQLLAKI